MAKFFAKYGNFFAKYGKFFAKYGKFFVITARRALPIQNVARGDIFHSKMARQ
jgi:hypothetical protein